MNGYVELDTSGDGIDGYVMAAAPGPRSGVLGAIALAAESRGRLLVAEPEPEAHEHEKRRDREAHDCHGHRHGMSLTRRPSACATNPPRAGRASTGRGS